MALVEVQGPRHRRLQGSRSHRTAGQARRHGEGRAVADHGRVATRRRWRFRRRMPASSRRLKVKLGDKVGEGSLVLVLEARARRAAAAAGAAAPAPLRPCQAAAAAAPAAAPRRRSGGGPVDVVVPDIGDFDEVAVIEVLRQSRRHDQGRAEPDHGRERQGVDGDPVVARRRREGASRSRSATRSPRARWSPWSMAAGGAGAAAAPAAPAAAASAPPPPRQRATAAPAPCRRPHCRRTSRRAAPSGALPHASPSIRKLARELGVPLEEVKGSGPEGPHHAGRRAGLRQGRDGRQRADRGAAAKAPAAAAAGGGASRACCPGRRSTSRSSAPSSARTCRASRRSAAPTCTATG